MTNKVNPIPAGYHSVTPYLIVNDANKALDFYKQAFAATEIMRFANPEGKVMHAEIKVGDSMVMLADECPEMKAVSAKSLGGSPVFLMLYVTDVDATFKQAVAAGATVEKPVADQFYGDRSGMLTDPFGHKWNIATHVKDLSDEEIRKASEACMKKDSQK